MRLVGLAQPKAKGERGQSRGRAQHSSSDEKPVRATGGACEADRLRLWGKSERGVRGQSIGSSPDGDKTGFACAFSDSRMAFWVLLEMMSAQYMYISMCTCQ